MSSNDKTGCRRIMRFPSNHLEMTAAIVLAVASGDTSKISLRSTEYRELGSRRCGLQWQSERISGHSTAQRRITLEYWTHSTAGTAQEFKQQNREMKATKCLSMM
ncbi:hypothetical protein CLAIMM_12886 [Cladophialophora immunda]|nr:hypothetical protein CLAIMM_12886 [Cladophialophora immunda]